MSFFDAISTDLVLKSSAVIHGLTTGDIARRSIQALNIPRRFEAVILALSDCPDTPKLRHWVSVSRSLVRSKLKVLDPEPRFVAHFCVDSLAADRIGELHAIRALEILLEHHLESGKEFFWKDERVLFPARFNIWGVGTASAVGPCYGLVIELTTETLRLKFGNGSIAINRVSRSVVADGGAAFEPFISVETSAGMVLIPLGVPGLADCYHSNAPIIQGMNANREWLTVLRAALDLLQAQDSAMARDCLRLAPAVLALHAGGTSYGSSSPQEVMGLVFLPGVKDPFDVAECYLHEALHQKLYRVEEGAPLFDGEHGDQEIYYSPWRSDARPLRMLVHGAYVFTGVAHFWKDIYTGSIDADAKANAGFHCYYRAKQAALAMDIVDKFQMQTAMGRKVSDIVRQGIEDVTADMELSATVKAEAHQRLDSHRSTFARHLS